MKKIILIVAVMALGTSAFAEHHKKVIEVTITNLTKGQPMTPPVLAIHASGFKLAQLGKPVSSGLGALAQDGVTAGLVDELRTNNKVAHIKVGSGVILPGKSAKFTFSVENLNYRLSAVSMLARTNDAVMLGSSLPLKIKKGYAYSYLAKVYDAGVEDNTESCDHIPAPPCNSANVPAGSGEGFIHPHPGVQGIADLLPLRDVFASSVAKIQVQRIK